MLCNVSLLILASLQPNTKTSTNTKHIQTNSKPPQTHMKLPLLPFFFLQVADKSKGRIPKTSSRHQQDEQSRNKTSQTLERSYNRSLKQQEHCVPEYPSAKQVSKTVNTFVSASHTFCNSKWHFLNALNTVLCIRHNNLT